MTETLQLAAAYLNAGRLAEAERCCAGVLAHSPGDATALCILAGAANAQRAHARALELIDRALANRPRWPPLLVERAAACLGLGDRSQARALAQDAVFLAPDTPNGYPVLAAALRPGENYYQVLARFHEWLKPRTYVEIGLETGASFVLARPPTLAVGIDPEPRLLSPPRTISTIAPLTSDAYFASRDLRRDLHAESFDLAFLDGDHRFAQTLCDFIHVECFAGPGSVVLVHDCLPVDSLTAASERRNHFWTGDVWKIIPCLRELRPDLDVFTIATAPSGLGVVASLDPRSTVLAESFDAIAARYGPLEVGADEEARRQVAAAIPNDWNEVIARMGRRRMG